MLRDNSILMRCVRSAVLVGLASAVSLLCFAVEPGSTSQPPPVTNTAPLSPEVRQLVDSARSAAGSESNAAGRPLIPVYPNGDDVRALANMGAARGRAAFENMKDAMSSASGPQTPLPASVVNAPAPPDAVSTAPDGLLVLAVSSSMPELMLRDYMVQLDRVPGVVVIVRGFIGGARTVGPTGAWIEKLLRVDPDCVHCPHRQVHVVVDPLAFRAMNITAVPALAYVPSVRELRHCDGETLKGASVVLGAVSIDAAVAALRKGGAQIPTSIDVRLKGARK